MTDHQGQSSDTPISTRLLFVLLALLFLIAPFYYQTNLGGEGSNIPYNVVLWIPALMIVTSAVLVMLKRMVLSRPRFFLLFISSPAVLLASSFIAGVVWPEDFIIRFGVILGGLLFWIALFQFTLSPKNRESVLYILLASLSLHATIGLLQLFQSPLSGYFFPIYSGRLEGMFQQANVFGTAMASGFTLGVYLLTSQFWHSYRWPHRWLVVLAITLCLALVLASGSRMTVLGGGVALLLLLASRAPLLMKDRRRLTTFIVAMALGLILGKSLDTHTGGISFAAAKYEKIADGSDARFTIYQIAFDAFEKSPLIGHGVGSFQRQFADARAEFVAQGGASLGDPRFSHPHNELLFWMVETGLLGLTGLILGAAAVVLLLASIGWPAAGAAGALILPITLHTLTELPFYLSNYHWFVLLILLWYLFSYPPLSEGAVRLSAAARSLLLSVAISFSALGSVFLTHTTLAQAGIMRFLKTGAEDVRGLQYGFDNIIYVELSTYISMGARLKNAYLQDDVAHVRRFIEWGTDHIRVIPHTLLYRDLTVAFDYLGEDDRARNILSEGLAIYPNYPALKKLQDDLNAGRPLYNTVAQAASTSAPRQATSAGASH